MTFLNHGEYEGTAAAYALGALDAEECASFRAHLDSCEECQRAVTEMRETISALPMAVPQVTPPVGLRDRVLSAVAEEAAPRAKTSPSTPGNVAAQGGVAFGGLRYALAAGIAAIALAGAVLAGWAIGANGADDGESPLLARSYEALTVMARADQRWDVQATSAAPGAWGVVAYDSEAGEASVVMWGLAEAEGAEYRVWVSQDGDRERVGRLYAADGGFWAVVPMDMASANGIGVTLVGLDGGAVDVLDAEMASE